MTRGNKNKMDSFLALASFQASSAHPALFHSSSFFLSLSISFAKPFKLRTLRVSRRGQIGDGRTEGSGVRERERQTERERAQELEVNAFLNGILKGMNHRCNMRFFVAK